MSAWLEPARDLVAVTPVSSAPGKKSTFYRAIYVDTEGTYEIATLARPESWTSVPLLKGMNPVSFCAVHTGAVAGNVWGVV